MYPYKVIYLDSNFVEKKKQWGVTRKGHTDGLATSKSLEALLIEQDKEGFDLVSITPMQGNVQTGAGYPIIATVGLLVTLKEKQSS